jgi:hypothetical protein
MDQTYQSQSSIPQSPPKNWLVESILVTIFCCQPFGIVGIIFALMVNRNFAAGDYNGALQASKDAAKWTKIGFIIGAVLIGGVFIFSFLFGGFAIWRSWFNND